MAILPAATAEFHLNGYVPYHGDEVAGIDRSSFKTESGLLVMLNQILPVRQSEIARKAKTC